MSVMDTCEQAEVPKLFVESSITSLIVFRFWHVPFYLDYIIAMSRNRRNNNSINVSYISTFRNLFSITIEEFFACPTTAPIKVNTCFCPVQKKSFVTERGIVASIVYTNTNIVVIISIRIDPIACHIFYPNIRTRP